MDIRVGLLLLFCGVSGHGKAIESEEAGALTPRQMALTGFEVLSDTIYPAEVNIWALDLTRRSAESGDPIALNNLGYFAATGNLRSLPGLSEERLALRHPEQALVYYEEAMYKGLLSAAMNLLELSDARPELEIAPEVLATAHMMVGRGYALGNNVLPYDYDKANKHYLTAAKLGNQQALDIIRELIGQFPDAFSDAELEGIEY